MVASKYEQIFHLEKYLSNFEMDGADFRIKLYGDLWIFRDF